MGVWVCTMAEIARILQTCGSQQLPEAKPLARCPHNVVFVAY